MAHYLVAVALCWSMVGCGSSPGDAGQGDAGPPPADAGPVSSCDPPGHFGGAPEHVFVLPPQGDGFSYGDVQAAFPDVDWQTLDRLYLPAGHYKNIELGNLPVRSAARPLIITNHGGQVVIGFNPDGNYIWSFGGGANWILTGRYDEVSQTGDVGFPGHACGNYADSAGRYGIISDDDYALSAPYLHMGLAVGDATDFEIEYVEVARSGFAGIRLLNHPDGGTDKPMRNVKVHDVYVHDTAGEGFYFGWTGGAPSNLFTNLQIYNCRILRTGNEALQIQDLGDGTHVHDNTIISGGLHWFDNGLGRYQDNLSQISTREGTIEIDHNVFIDGAGSLVSFWSQPQGDDGDRHVSFHDNYFGNAASIGVYLGGEAAATSSFSFSHNVFRDFVFAYDELEADATDPGTLFSGGAYDATITLDGNRWQGSQRLVAGLTGGDGSAGAFTASGNRNDDPPAIALVNAGSGTWDRPGHHLSSWAANATVIDGSPQISFRMGDVVTFGEAPTLYQCTAPSTTASPPAAPWSALPTPADDVRTVPGSDDAAMGVR
jgi:hypothetical protein